MRGSAGTDCPSQPQTILSRLKHALEYEIGYNSYNFGYNNNNNNNNNGNNNNNDNNDNNSILNSNVDTIGFDSWALQECLTQDSPSSTVVGVETYDNNSRTHMIDNDSAVGSQPAGKPGIHAVAGYYFITHIFF